MAGAAYPYTRRRESSAAPIGLDTLLLRARQHELEHLADIWRVALYWDRPAPDASMSGRLISPSTPPTDSLKESHWR